MIGKGHVMVVRLATFLKIANLSKVPHFVNQITFLRPKLAQYSTCDLCTKLRKSIRDQSYTEIYFICSVPQEKKLL